MSTNQFKNPVINWVDKRLPVVSPLHHTLFEHPFPRNLNFMWNFGSLAGFSLVIMIITGIILAMQYTPNTADAFGSVERIMRDVNSGWLMRYIHMNGASFFFIVVYIHMLRGLYYGSYKAPRELLWIIGVVILLLMMATGFLGYTLPWGQMSFWGATVITNLFSAIPGVGDAIVTWLWGGFSVDNPTLNRFFVLHFLLPFVILGVVILHILALHTSVSNNPLGIDIKGPQDTISFHPYFTIKDMLGVCVFLLIFCVFVFFMPNDLGHPDNYIPADPLVTPAHIVPEWYFLPFYAVLRAVDFNIGIPFTDIVLIDSKLGGVLAMFGAIAVLFFVPWLDTSDVKSANYRPTYKIFFWIFAINAVFLGYLGSRPAEGIWIPLMKASTFWYFLHFIVIMPLLGWFEKPLPRPASITDAVLSKASSGGASQIDGAAAEPQSKG